MGLSFLTHVKTHCSWKVFTDFSTQWQTLLQSLSLFPQIFSCKYSRVDKGIQGFILQLLHVLQAPHVLQLLHVLQVLQLLHVDTNFKIGTEPIEIVQEYTYLGTRLTPTGDFTLAQEHLKEKALHAFSSTRQHTLLHRLNPNTASQIFDTMIFPILSYNSEVWGMYTKQDFKKWDNSAIENIHLKFCKRYLEVNSKASNLACRAELGRLPLIVPISHKNHEIFCLSKQQTYCLYSQTSFSYVEEPSLY